MRQCVAILGLLGFLTTTQPAFAQAEMFFGIMNQMIQEGARQQQIQREREHRQQEIYRQHEAQIALVRRVQTALKELGFYTMAVDGSVGPGTRRAIADYQRAFNLPERQMQESDILALERRAAAGFRSHSEAQHAQSRGFSTRRDMQAANAAGFDNARDWEAARQAGVESAEKWRAYRASGFATYRDYLDGQRRGFATRRALELAERDGFDTAQEHEAFRRSGVRNREEFLRQRERLEAAGRAREECLEAVSERDWPRAAPRCRQAAVVIRDDDALLAARATAERQLDLAITTIRADRQRLERDLELAKDALALAQADLDDLAQGSGEDGRAEARRDEARASRDERAGDLEGLAQALADADAALERAERGRVRASCLEDSEAGRWSAAVTACGAAVAADSSDRESAELLAQAEVKHEAEREQAEEQRRVMALADARRESAAVIEALDAFAASGGVFQNPLPMTRAVVNLKAALTRNEPQPLLQAQAALADLLAQEQPFQEFRQARLAAARAAEASALAKAEGNARRLEAFIRDYLGRNVLSSHAAKLLALQEKLEDVLASDDPDRITRQQAEAQAELDRLGLGGESRSFTIAPRVAASDLREQEAEAAQARLTLVTARERAGALLEELEAFVKTGARFEAAIPVARGIAALRSVREGGDMAVIEDARRTLESALGGEAAFADFRSRRLEAQAVATNDGAVTAAARLERKRAFIETYVGANPLDPNLDALLAAHGAISDALDAGTSGGLALTLDEMRLRFSQLGLADALARYAATEAQPDDGAQIARAPGGLAITALNAALLEGDARDILILRNGSGSAPNLRINLRGEPVFDGRQAMVCWMHAPPPQAFAVDRALQDLRRAGAQALIGGRRCDPRRLLEQDLVLLERGSFLADDVIAAQALVQQFEEGALSLFSMIAWRDIRDESERGDRFVTGLREELAAGVRKGVGFIALPSGGDALCVVDGGGDEHARALDAHLVVSAQDDIALYLPTLSREVREDAERVFARAGRGECGAVMASDEPLDALLAGLARDGVQHRLTPIWFEADRVAQAREAVIARDEERLRALAAMRQDNEAQALLARERREEAEARRQAREAELRSTYAQEARAAFNDIQEAALAIVDGAARADRSDMPFAALAKWRAEHVAGGWEFIGQNAGLIDFGLADWSGRRLEAVVIRLELESRNRTLGSYHEACIVMGYLIDAEFERRRDFFQADCSQAERTVEQWRSGRNFASRWVARLEE